MMRVKDSIIYKNIDELGLLHQTCEQFKFTLNYIA